MTEVSCPASIDSENLDNLAFGHSVTLHSPTGPGSTSKVKKRSLALTKQLLALLNQQRKHVPVRRDKRFDPTGSWQKRDEHQFQRRTGISP